MSLFYALSYWLSWFALPTFPLLISTFLFKFLDVPAKTATGTIALKVEDTNDHCPILTSSYHQTCDNNKVVNVTAFDEDANPNAAPFQFALIEEESVGKWQMVPINGKDKDGLLS